MESWSSERGSWSLLRTHKKLKNERKENGGTTSIQDIMLSTPLSALIKALARSIDIELELPEEFESQVEAWKATAAATPTVGSGPSYLLAAMGIKEPEIDKPAAPQTNRLFATTLPKYDV